MYTRMKSITKLVLGTATLVVASTITAKVARDTFFHRLPSSLTHPITEYEAAMAKIAHIQAFERTLKLQAECYTTVLTHGCKVEQVIVLMHGMTSCPLQFAEFGSLLFEQGYNVLIPRMPYNGYTDLETTDLRYLTMKDLCDSSAIMVDIAHGLGEHVTYAGLSVGGTMAAWVAQYRADVDRAILIAPAFTIDRHLSVNVSKLVMYLLYLLPNVMTQRFRKGHGSPFGYRGFATRSLAVMMRLGFSVYEAAHKAKPAVQSVLVVTNAADPSMNNAIIRGLIQRWQKNGLRYCEVYEFDASHHLPHDIIGTQNPRQHVAFVYPILLALITRKQNVEGTDQQEQS
ncbi:MAG: hypothetical protein NVSMB38_23150 [Ktedonobacteraceae bacterium]